MVFSSYCLKHSDLIANVDRLIPIASIITPRTLSIRQAPVEPVNQDQLHVPNLDFRSLSFLANMVTTYSSPFTNRDPTLGSEIHAADWRYNGPSQEVATIASSVLAEGLISQITPPAVNASCDLDFVGPSLRCSNVSDTLRRSISSNIYAHSTRSCKFYGYLAWFAKHGWPGLDVVNMPFIDYSRHTNSSLNSSLSSLEFSNALLVLDTIAMVSKSASSYPQAPPATMYIFVQPSLFERDAMSPKQGVDQSWCVPKVSGIVPQDLPEWTDGTMLQCQLYNSTYHVSFHYEHGKQNITIGNQSAGTDQLVPTIFSAMGPTHHSPQDYSCAELDFGWSNLTNQCYKDPEVLRTFSYEAIMDAFTTHVTGSLESEGGTTRNSGVLQTALGDTKDLEFIKSRLGRVDSLQNLLSRFNGTKTDVSGLSRDKTSNPYSKLTIGDAIEDSFQKLIVSLMSSAALQ